MDISSLTEADQHLMLSYLGVTKDEMDAMGEEDFYALRDRIESQIEAQNLKDSNMGRYMKSVSPTYFGQALGGLIDLYNSAGELGSNLLQWGDQLVREPHKALLEVPAEQINKHINYFTGGLTSPYLAEEIDLPEIGILQPDALLNQEFPRLPTADPAQGIDEMLVRGGAHMAGGYMMAARMLGPKLAQNEMVTAGFAGFLGFSGKDPNLGNTIEELFEAHPNLADAFGKLLLATDEDAPELVNRLYHASHEIGMTKVTAEIFARGASKWREMVKSLEEKAEAHTAGGPAVTSEDAPQMFELGAKPGRTKAEEPFKVKDQKEWRDYVESMRDTIREDPDTGEIDFDFDVRGTSESAKRETLRTAGGRFFNFRNLETEADVQNLINKVSLALAEVEPKLEKPRRQSVIRRRAERKVEAGMDLDDIIGIGKKVDQQSANAEALRIISLNHAKFLEDLINLPSSPEVDAEILAHLELAGFFQHELKQAATAFGRGLGQWRMKVEVGGVDPSLLRSIAQAYGDRNTGHNVRMALKMAKKAEVKNPGFYQKFMKNLGYRAYRKLMINSEHLLNEYVSGLMSNPKTVVRNMLGGEMKLAMALVERQLAGFLKDSGIAPQEAAKALMGMWYGKMYALKSAALSFVTDSPVLPGPYRNELHHPTSGHFLWSDDPGVAPVIGRMLARVSRGGTRLQMASDELIRSQALFFERFALADRYARKAASMGNIDYDTAYNHILTRNIDSPINFMFREIDELEQKFVQESVFARPMGSAESWFKTPFKKASTGATREGEEGERYDLFQLMNKLRDAFPPLRIFLPFFSTPVNLTRDSMSHVPVLGRIVKEHHNDLGGLNGAEAQSLAKAKTWVGSSIMIYSAIRTWQGGMTTWMPPRTSPDKPIEQRDKRAVETDVLRESGFQTHAFVTEDGYRSYAGLDPLSLIVQMGSDASHFCELLMNVGPEFFKGETEYNDAIESLRELFGHVGMMWGGFADERMMLRGISQLQSLAKSDPRQRGSAFEGLMKSVNPLDSTLSSFRAAVARGEDPYVRNTVDPSLVKNYLKRWKARNPWFTDLLGVGPDGDLPYGGGGSTQLNPRINYDGVPQLRYTIKNGMFSPKARRFFDSMLNPMPETHRDKSIITQTVQKLGGVGVSPPSHWRYKTVKVETGESFRIDLTDRQQYLWGQKFANTLYDMGVHKRVESAEFREMDPGTQVIELNELLSTAKEVAWTDLVYNDPAGTEIKQKITDAQVARAKAPLSQKVIDPKYIPPEEKKRQQVELGEFIQQ